MKHETTNLWRRFTVQVLQKNAVLVQAAGLCPILTAGISLKYGVALTVCLLLSMLPATLVLGLCGRRLPKFLMAPVYLLTAGASLAGMAAWINTVFSTELYAALYLFFPIIAVNTLLFCHGAEARGEYRLSRLLPEAAGSVVGFGLVICAVSALREWVAFGTIWGHAVAGSPRIPGATLPFAAFLLLGVMAALLQALKRRLTPEKTEVNDCA